MAQMKIDSEEARPSALGVSGHKAQQESWDADRFECNGR